MPKKTSNPIDDTPKTPSSAYLRMWRRAEEEASGKEQRNDSADVWSRTRFFLHQEERQQGGGNPNIIELLRKLQQTIEGIGLRTVSGPTTEELAILELLEQRFIYQRVIDSILWPSLRKRRLPTQKFIDQQIDTALKRERSLAGKKGAKVSAEVKKNATIYRDIYLKLAWRNLEAKNVPIGDRPRRIAEIMASDAQAKKPYPHSYPAILIKALKTDTISRLAKEIGLRTDGI